MADDIKSDHVSTFKVTHSREFYRGKSFYFAGEWKPGCHYVDDEYISHFVNYKNCLLKCSKSHLSTTDTEPKNLIFDESGTCIGVDSIYWTFVLSGVTGSISSESIIRVLGYVPANESDLQWKVDKIPGYGLSQNDFTNEYRDKLQSLNIKYNTTAYWDAEIGFVPEKGEIIVYSDYKTKNVNGTIVNIPGIKIGSGNGYVQDLSFLNEDEIHDLYVHMNDDIRHITAEERKKWNSKLNVTDAEEVIQDTLILNRN